MAYEFKKLSAVDVVAEPAESANVLIEENGVIKKAPKTAVGGGNTEWDAVFEYINTDDQKSVNLISGDYESVYNKTMEQQEVPNIKMLIATQSGDFAYAVRKVDVDVVVSSNDNNDHYIVIQHLNTAVMTIGEKIYWYPDNSLELY